MYHVVRVSSQPQEWWDFLPPTRKFLLFILLALFVRRAHSPFYMTHLASYRCCTAISDLPTRIVNELSVRSLRCPFLIYATFLSYFVSRGFSPCT